MSTPTELQQLLRDKYDIDGSAIGPDTPMPESGMDSLAIAEFMFAVEDHFHVTLPDDDPNISTLAQLAALVDRVRTAQPPEPSVPQAVASTDAPVAAAVTEEK